MRYIVLLCLLIGLNTINAQPKVIDLKTPDVFVSSVPSDLVLNISNVDADLQGDISFEINGNTVESTWENNVVTIHTEVDTKSELKVYDNGKLLYEKELTPIPLWMSILPPLIAILMALLTKEVFSSLFVGLLVGTTIIWRYKGFSIFLSLFKGMFTVVDTYALAAVNDSGHISIIIFSMLIGGMVALITLNGGMKGVVNKLSRYANSPRSGQFITWLMGLLIFFDDYANTLVVGNTMRPVTDKLKVSREKLAYIVDSTSAPIAAIAFITTWIGAELSYITEGIDQLGLNQSAYQVFLHSLKYSFYPIFTLGFVLMLILKKKDFGPMYQSEIAARNSSSGDLSEPSAAHVASEFDVPDSVKGRWYNAFIPVVVVVVGTIAGLVYTGWDATVWNDPSLSITTKLSEIIGNADSFVALLWSSLLGVLAALSLTLAQRISNLREAMEGMVGGFKTMFNAVLILVLAWSIALITEHMHTAIFITDLLKFLKMSPYWVPALTFVFSTLIAFSTGSSWGTMAIIYPLILPACWKISMEYGFTPEMALPIFYNVVSTVLAGSVLGDHCSPISDTTILSSLASSCNHLSHVRTQMPYALLVGGVSVAVGTIPAAFGISSIWLFIAGFALLYVAVIKLGKAT